MSSCQGLHGSPAALRLVVGSVVGLRLNFDLQAVWTRAGRQLPVKGGQGWAAGGKNVYIVVISYKQGVGELISR